MTTPEKIVRAKGDPELKSQAPNISGYGIVKSIRREDEQGNLSPSFVILGLWAFLMLLPSIGQAQVMYGGGVGGDIQYSEDSPHVSGDKGTMAGVVQQTADTALSGNGDRSFMQIDENGFLKINLKALSVTIAGEDVLNGLLKVEERYLTMPAGGSTPKIAADQLYKTGIGLVKSIDCYSDATATAGTIAVLDSTTAGAGTKIFEFDVLAVAYNPTGLKQELNVPFSVGLYLDFTTTADMQCTVRYR